MKKLSIVTAGLAGIVLLLSSNVFAHGEGAVFKPSNVFAHGEGAAAAQKAAPRAATGGEKSIVTNAGSGATQQHHGKKGYGSTVLQD